MLDKMLGTAIYALMCMMDIDIYRFIQRWKERGRQREKVEREIGEPWVRVNNLKQLFEFMRIAEKALIQNALTHETFTIFKKERKGIKFRSITLRVYTEYK